MAQLELKNLVKVYPFTKPGLLGRKKALEALEREKTMPNLTNEGVLAVRDFSLQVEQGEFLVLLGPSGCGKSSLLRMISGLEEVSTGDVMLEGTRITSWRTEERDMALISQQLALYPHLTVYDNLAFSLRSQRTPRAELDQRVRETAELLQLTPLLERRPKELSGGEQQRVALGRAIVRRPRLFLMDEPFSSLDPPLRMKMRGVVRDIHERLGVTVIFVTHDQAEAMALADRIALMREGQLVQVGPPHEIFFHPQNVYAACAVGLPRINLIPARLTKAPEGAEVDLLGISQLISLSAETLLNGRRVTAGIRPVHLHLGGRISAKVLSVLPMGKEAHLEVSAAGETLTMVAPAPPPARPILPGQEITLDFEPRYLHLFDADTRERIEGAEYV